MSVPRLDFTKLQGHQEQPKKKQSIDTKQIDTWQVKIERFPQQLEPATKPGESWRKYAMQASSSINPHSKGVHAHSK